MNYQPKIVILILLLDDENIRDHVILFLFYTSFKVIEIYLILIGIICIFKFALVAPLLLVIRERERERKRGM